MEISYIVDYLVLAEELNFSRAAIKRNISQPTLSNHIQSLENELGTTLFDRTRHKVELTKPGRLLLSDAQKVLDAFEKMHRFDAKASSGNKAITIGGFLDNQQAIGLLATRMFDFSNQSGTELRMLCDQVPFNQRIEKITDGSIDLCIGYANMLDGLENEDIVSMPFITDPFYVVLNCDNPLASKESLSLEDLKSLVFIKLASPRFVYGWDRIEQACKQAGFTPRRHAVFVDAVTDFPFMELGVNKCFVISYNGLSGAFALKQRQDLTIVPIEDEHFVINLFYSKNNHNKTLCEFLDYLQQHDCHSPA